MNFLKIKYDDGTMFLNLDLMRAISCFPNRNGVTFYFNNDCAENFCLDENLKKQLLKFGIDI
jgi:hypothetical protein